jgi:hypothetical protein
MTGRKRKRATSKASKSGRATAKGSGKKLAEDFLARLNYFSELHASEFLDRVYVERPQLYFKALVKLATLEIEPSQLNDFDPRRNREDVLQRLGQPTGYRPNRFLRYT